jgi:hypothetical protein
LGEILFKEYRDITWKRESELENNNNSNNNTSILPQDDIFINKIIYNKLSNPNLYSALNALSNNPERIKKLFINSKKDLTCLFGVNIGCNGNLQQVVIDDFFPLNKKHNNSKIFLSEEKGLLWPQILEKAYAKVFGSYNLISERSMESILKDLTCAPVVTLDSFGDNLSKELLEAYKKKWIIMAGAGDTIASEDLLRDLGLPPNVDHEISLVYKLTEENINQITSNSLNIPTNDDYNTVLKIRNLLGKIEWIGDWSDYSGLWNDNFKNILNYNSAEKSFYMNLKDFKLYFSRIKICKYMENYKYQSISVSQKPDEYALIKIKASKIDDFIENSESFISFIQEEEIKTGKERKNSYSLGRLILCRLYNDEIHYIKGKLGQEREIVLEHQLEHKGEEYLLFCQLDKVAQNIKFIISVYSPENTELEIIPYEEFPNILEKIYISCAKLSGKADHLENGAIECYKYSYTTPEGYSYIYIENHENDATYIEDIKYTKFDGLKLLPPFKGTSYHIEVGPHSNQIILIKHLDLSEYSLIFSYQSNVLYGKKTLIKYTKEKGKQKKRTDKKTKSEIDIIVYTYKYSFGLCYYYENKTNDKRLKEKINITNNSNIEFMDQPEGTNEINVILDPGQNYFVELRGKSVLWKVQPYISYNIENINHSPF